MHSLENTQIAKSQASVLLLLPWSLVIAWAQNSTMTYHYHTDCHHAQIACTDSITVAQLQRAAIMACPAYTALTLPASLPQDGAYDVRVTKEHARTLAVLMALHKHGLPTELMRRVFGSVQDYWEEHWEDWREDKIYDSCASCGVFACLADVDEDGDVLCDACCDKYSEQHFPDYWFDHSACCSDHSRCGSDYSDRSSDHSD